ncbi:uncharacterized protein LOC134203267 [Armigeres subalbatus]|uniref:uncharacterized protein LOC134203267 n=1 Tax=Armigeres subalbatus TaxID=124917 RepID=UPI002ED26893
MMSRHITETDISLDYSSEPDEYESEYVQDLLLLADQFEVYVGNTGKVNYEKYYCLFKQHGFMKDMTFWRTHNHLYHARVVYRSKGEADKAVEQMNNRKFFGKRIRVWHALEKVELDYAAAIRVDDLAADVSEEDIFDHFLSCGDIKFVVKTGFAAYVQFASSSAASQSLGLEMILNGDPYTLSRIAADDRIDHAQVIENMKDIKYRKPFVIVENYPELPFEDLNRYKSNFESIAPVRHFKIAPTGDKTVTLALCMDKAADRDAVINRFKGAIIMDKKLKVYLVPGKARMTAAHVAKYAICKNSITVDNVRPYLKDYDVSSMFKKCGTISFLEKLETRWIICFDSPSAVSLARSYHQFSLYRKVLKVCDLTQETLPVSKKIQLRDRDGHIKLHEEEKKPNTVTKYGRGADDFLRDLLKTMDKNIKNDKNIEPLADAAGKQQPVPQKPKQFGPSLKTKGTAADVKVTASKPSSSDGSDKPSTSAATQNKDNNPLVEDADNIYTTSCLTVANLPKGIEENDLRELFQPSRIKHVHLYCSKDPYYPSSAAILNALSKADAKQILTHHHDTYRGKRVLIKHSFLPGMDFLPANSLILKQLPPNVNEEGILTEVQKILGPDTVEDVIKPANHYAYFDLKEDISAHTVLNRLRGAMTRFKIDVFPLYCRLPKTFLNLRSHSRKTIEEMRTLCGAQKPDVPSRDDKEFGVHNAHKLFVGNIPRDTLAEDVIAYFNNYGSVIDYSAVEKKSCYLRKSAIISFMNLKHAENAFCQQPHYLEGSKLGVHLMDSPPFNFAKDERVLTVKFHSPFITDDEIRFELLSVLNIVYDMRFDAFDDRANYVAKYKITKNKYPAFEALLNTEYINNEAVKIVQGYDPSPPTDKEARESSNIGNSPFRRQKEKYLSYTNYNENIKEDMELRSKPRKETDIPFKSFFNDNSIQINNVSLDTTLEHIRDLFIKCGDIVDYRALILEEDNSKICFVRFKIDLAADLACTYNQKMVNGKRILVHLARETLVAEREQSVLLERLNPVSTTEDVHAAFSQIGTVKYVQKQSPFTAIVCFKDKDSMLEAVNVSTIPKSGQFIVNPCYEEYDPRLFNNFCCQEEHISFEHLRNVLRPRILPEFHQLELERQVFESLPDDIKTHLINEVFLAREKIPSFNMFPKHQQINILKNKYPEFTQREHFVRLTPREQEKLLDVTSKLQHDYPYEDVKDTDVLPPAPKQVRLEDAAPRKPDKAFAANWYSDASQEPVPMPSPFPDADMGMQQMNVPMNANHVAQALPSSGLLGFPDGNPPLMEFPPQSSMFQQRGVGPGGFFNVCPPQHQPNFNRGNGGPMGPSPSFGPPHTGRMPGPMGGNPSPWMQQRMAAMAYNAGSPSAVPMGFQRPPFFN